MPRRRVRYTSIEDTSMEGDVFYYRECKGSTPRPGTGLKHARVTTPPPPARHVMMLMQCKMCVTVCCGDDCRCKNPAPMEILQAIGEVQPENSECKTCVNMCCGSACQCKDQLMPTETEANRTTTPSSVTPKLEESQEDRVAFTVKRLNHEAFADPTVARIINLLCKGDFDIVGVGDGSVNKGRMKSITLNIVKKVGREAGNVTLIYDETASGYDFYHFCIINVGVPGDSGTRDYIRRVLSHDGDISAILKDLVRVTLQKVDLMKKMDGRRKNAAGTMDVDDTDARL